MKAICFPEQRSCINTSTINHHKGHLLSRRANGGATTIDLPRSGDGNDRCKYTTINHHQLVTHASFSSTHLTISYEGPVAGNNVRRVGRSQKSLVFGTRTEIAAEREQALASLAAGCKPSSNPAMTSSPLR